MKKIFKIIFSMALSVSMVLPQTSIAFAKESTSPIQAEQKFNSISTPNEYENWLKEKALTDSEASKSLEEFNSLSKENKEKFISYLNDESLMRDMLNSISNSKEGETTSLKNGDIKISVESKQPSNGIRTRSASRYVKQVCTAKVFDTVTLIRTLSELTYTVVGSKAGVILNSNHEVITNINPFLGLDWSNKYDRTMGSKAYSSCDLTYSIIWKGVLTVGVKRLTLWGDIYGNSDITIQNL